MNIESFYIIAAVSFGLIIGSFLNVCIYRIPRGMGLMGRSQCPHCKQKIAFYDNIPVLSFILLRRRCRHCHQKIGLLYPMVELIVAGLSVLTLIHVTFNLPTYFIWFLLFVCPLIVITFIDFEHRIIPDIISLPGIGIGILVTVYKLWPFWPPALLYSIFGILCGGGTLLILSQLYFWVRKREGMGGGDIKLAAMLGAFVGWKGMIFVFLVSSVLAILYAILSMGSRQQKGPIIIPYGPFLAVASLIFYFYGNHIANSYFSLVGLPYRIIF